jgi:glycosyltransferase involved in cell wall biosynthesis
MSRALTRCRERGGPVHGVAEHLDTRAGGRERVYYHSMGGEESAPRVSVIIPSLDGYREGCVPRLLASVESQTFRDFETHVIKGVSPQGKAINEGAAKARGEILVILDDDSRIADGSVFQRLVDALDGDASVGMAGASIVLPPEASAFQRRASGQFPRFNTPVVERVTDSDLACHGCCAIPLRIFEEVGREREDLVRGLDPDLRVRLREAGYRVVLVPHARIYHPLPDGWRRLVRVFFRNGFGSAYAWKFQPESVYETHESVDAAAFRPRTPWLYRVVRFPFRLVKALVQGRLMRLVAYCAYAAGYMWGLLTAKEL